MNTQQRIAWLKLARVKGLGPARIQRLLDEFELHTLLKADEQRLAHSTALTERMLAQWLELRDDTDEEYRELLSLCADHDISIVPLVDERYPQRLREIGQAPLTLYCRGDASLLKKGGFALVGSRDASERALEWTARQSRVLAENGCTVISGGAKGVDIAAHRAAIQAGGATMVVLGSGVLNAYPKEHRAFFERVSEEGGLVVSEHPPSFAGTRYSLLQRNRITSGLADAVLACEVTSERSGTAAQCKYAADQGRPLLCRRADLLGEPSRGMVHVVEEFGAREVDDAEQLLSLVDVQQRYRQKTLA